MRHPGEEELIALYYGEAPRAVSTHLKSCKECAARYTDLRQALDAILPMDLELPQDHGERLWETLRPRLVPHEKASARFRSWQTIWLAAGAAMLLAAAFLGGRHWERHAAGRQDVLSAGQRPQQRTVLVVVLTDHLDQTERLLMALEHAAPTDQAEGAQLRSQARELLASNRLYRTAARGAGDPLLAGALERLNGVLAEIANDPDLTAEDLQRLRQGMNTRGLLFEIRVLMSRKPPPPEAHSHARGRSI